jgi:hypothetical protein
METRSCRKTRLIELGFSLIAAFFVAWTTIVLANWNGRVLFPILLSLALIWEPKFFTELIPGIYNHQKTKLVGWIILSLLAAIPIALSRLF